MRVLPAILVLVCCTAVLPAAQRDAMVEFSNLSQTEKRLQAEVREIEDQLLIIRGLPPADRYAKGRKLGDDLERLLRKVEGSRYENHALFWLADWSITYEQDYDRVINLVQRVLASPNPARKGASRALYTRALLAKGRTTEAENVATALVTDIAEFEPVLRLVEFTKRVGQRAPMVSGRNLTGGAEDPISSRNEPWLLYAFISLGDPAQRFGLDRLLNELGREEYRGVVQLVIVAFDGDPLLAMDAVRDIPRGGEAQLLWANPNEDGDAETWRQAWGLPTLPITALVGPDRSIMAANPEPARLRPLAGLDPDSKAPGSGGDNAGGGLWRGKRGTVTNRR